MRPMSRRCRVGVLGASLALCLGWAFVLNIALNVSTFAGDARPNHLTLAVKSPTLWVSTLFLWMLILGVLALSGRLWITLGLVTVLASTLAAINASKLELRGDPLQPSDTMFLGEAGFLGEVVGGRTVVVSGLAIAVALMFFFALGRLIGRWIPPATRGLAGRERWLVRSMRVAVVLMVGLLLVTASRFHDAHNPVRAAFDASGAHWKPWKQRSNYRANGFIGGTLFNLGVKAMPRPSGYSERAMGRIADRYSALASRANEDRQESLADVNVVLVLSESFSQPRWLSSVTWSEDPIPNTTRLMSQTPSGKLLTPGFGGGTANVEFELLTGQSMSIFSPQVQVAYDQVVPKRRDYPSFVDEFRRAGHRAVAIHPYAFTMYRRAQVLPTLGFDELVDQEGLRDRRKKENSRFISDESAYAEVVRRIESDPSPQLLHLITMQNHLPYAGSYENPIAPTSGLTGRARARAGQYVRGLHNTDAALPGLLQALRATREKVMLVFYGDHLPGEIYPSEVQSREGSRTMHETPWFIWSNYRDNEHRSLPTVSANQLMPLLKEAADVPMTPMEALLTELRSSVPGLDAGLLVGPDDQLVRRKELTAHQRDVLRDYRLTQFDLSVGRRYVAERMLSLPSRASR